MTPKLYTRVVLVRDVPEAQLQAGDVAMYIEHLPVANGDDGAVLEVFNMLGDSIAVQAVPLAAIAPLSADDLPAVRRAPRAKPE